MQTGLALLDRSGLATAKPHSSLPLVVADPNFSQSLHFSRLYSIISRYISDPSHLPIPCPEVTCPISPTSAHRMLLPYSYYDAYFHPCLFPRHFFPQTCPIQLDASPCFGTRFPFLLTNVDPSPNLSFKTCFTHSPQTTSIMTMNGTS